MRKIQIGVLVGSARTGSYSQGIAEGIAECMPEHYQMNLLAIDNLPMFNADYDEENVTPLAWSSFREKVHRQDGYLFVTPEYNRSVPPLLKNALDIASRPYGENCWDGKPGAVVSVSQGKIGGFGANHHLRQIMTFLNVYMMQQPEAYIGNAGELLQEKGEGTIAFLQKIAEDFARWVEIFYQR